LAVEQVIDYLLSAGGVGGLRRRLEDNALVLLRRGERRSARLAMAAAARLDPDDVSTAYRSPLLQALAERALEAAGAARPASTPPAGPVMPATPARSTPARSTPAPPAPAADVVDETTGLRRRPSGLILPG
jgi:hypothetical protein